MGTLAAMLAAILAAISAAIVQDGLAALTIWANTNSMAATKLLCSLIVKRLFKRFFKRAERRRA
jgi:ABC-type Co2+ transport system permease subunit